MARTPPRDSDRDFPPDPDARGKTGNAEKPERLLADSETLEPFDDSIRARFGRIISLMATKRKRS
jgi:hypothetical protein